MRNFTAHEYEDEELFAILENTPQAKVVTADLQENLNLFKFKGEALSEITANLEEEFIICKRELEREGIKEQLLKIGADIERLEREDKRVEIASLLQNFRSLSEKLKMLS